MLCVSDNLSRGLARRIRSSAEPANESIGPKNAKRKSIGLPINSKLLSPEINNVHAELSKRADQNGLHEKRRFLPMLRGRRIDRRQVPIAREAGVRKGIKGGLPRVGKNVSEPRCTTARRNRATRAGINADVRRVAVNQQRSDGERARESLVAWRRGEIPAHRKVEKPAMVCGRGHVVSVISRVGEVVPNVSIRELKVAVIVCAVAPDVEKAGRAHRVCVAKRASPRGRSYLNISGREKPFHEFF